MLTVRRVLGGVRLIWRDLLFLAMLTPATFGHNFGYRKPFCTNFWSILGILSLLEQMEQVVEPTEVSFNNFQVRGA
jgi:hypothetical protein